VNWPPSSLFEYKPYLGEKYSLSSVNNPVGYFKFLEKNDTWKAAYNTLNSAKFFYQVLDMLSNYNIDLCLPRHKFMARSINPESKRTGASSLNKFFYRLKNIKQITSRFEFSMMSANGGCILPHTDSPNKLITMVFSMNKEGEWNSAWGGGTAVLDPIDPQRSFNFRNDQLKFDECQILKTYAFNPNQCLMFIKTFNSLHAVLPMAGPREALRKTLTLNIEYLNS